MTAKSQFIVRAVDAVTQLALSEETISGLAGVFTARGYASGPNAITDQDLADAGINLTAADFTSNVAIILAEYMNFCNNAVVVTKDRKTSMNIARRDI